jgi:hypothetical protein
MPKQLNIFYNPVNKPVITYSSLSIHQKINYKANECGLHVVYKNKYNYFTKPLYKAKTESLTVNYIWHHKVNGGFNNRIDNYRKQQNKQLELYKQSL